jgi:hypothetical protein
VIYSVNLITNQDVTSNIFRRYEVIIAYFIKHCKPEFYIGGFVMKEYESIGENDVKAFIYKWFAGFDRIEKNKEFFKKHMDPENVDMYYPKNPIKTIQEFDKWHDEEVIGKIQSNIHHLSNVQVRGDENNGFFISLDINWKANFKDKSRENINIHQNWEVKVDQKRNFIITKHRAEVIDKNEVNG